MFKFNKKARVFFTFSLALASIALLGCGRDPQVSELQTDLDRISGFCGYGGYETAWVGDDGFSVCIDYERGLENDDYFIGLVAVDPVTGLNQIDLYQHMEDGSGRDAVQTDVAANGYSFSVSSGQATTFRVMLFENIHETTPIPGSNLCQDMSCSKADMIVVQVDYNAGPREEKVVGTQFKGEAPTGVITIASVGGGEPFFQIKALQP